MPGHATAGTLWHDPRRLNARMGGAQGFKYSLLATEAVGLVISSGRPIAQVTPEIGIVEGTLGNWVRLWKEEHPGAGAAEPGPVEWAKFKALQSENTELKRGIDFLGYPEVRIMVMFA